MVWSGRKPAMRTISNSRMPLNANDAFYKNISMYWWARCSGPPQIGDKPVVGFYSLSSVNRPHIIHQKRNIIFSLLMSQ